ncbi:angiopoietin-related protein 7-like isoform X3 [Myxocyprinus asiaticus]|uniref:angiopoietin-related protein 7-like isoform X3 n=1 Tax=Myxocyprinus asiaticus TaxID=70543 RepID=UPI002223D2C3|nr:angiopoietin-related protein 7-like isoform X3 [Myxocyprinus asiaticus]
MMRILLSNPYFTWRTSSSSRMKLSLLYGLLFLATWVQVPVVKSKDAVKESQNKDLNETDSPKTDSSQTDTHHISIGQMQCGEYSKEVMPNEQCRLIATLPQLEEQRCPDMFRCTDEVSYWLHENEERKEQMQDLKETISELQEELRNHRHRIKVLELQSEKYGMNSSLENRFHTLQQLYEETNALLHIHGSLIYDMQTQIRNLTMIVERVRRNPGCMINIIRTSPLLSAQDTLHPGGGWTMFQRRQDGKINFNRKWTEYRDGFGDLRAEFWLGNDHIHDISSQGDYSLRIDLEDWNGKHKHALYQNFWIENEENHYRLHVSGFSGTVEDSFSWYHDKQSFSTPDTGDICAEISHGGWWYHQCFFSNLNGVYYKGGRYSAKGKNLLGPDGIVWYSWKDSDYYSLKKVSMMIRPRMYRPRLSP